MSEDDIKDIFYCTRFRTTEYHDELQNGISIDIATDDLIAFSKTPEYWAKVNSSMAAFEELITIPPRVLNYEEMSYWLDKYAFTRENIQEDVDSFSFGMKWSPFIKLYAQLCELKEYISSHVEEFAEANNSYQRVAEEKDLITWMLKYENMFAVAPFAFKYDLFEAGEDYVSEKIENLVFSGPHFKEAFSFIANYHKHRFEVLNKYGIYSQDEISAIIGHEEYDFSVNPVYSLKFHLEKREEAAELGIPIPFNLNGYVAELDAKK